MPGVPLTGSAARAPGRDAGIAERRAALTLRRDVVYAAAHAGDGGDIPLSAVWPDLEAPLFTGTAGVWCSSERAGARPGLRRGPDERADQRVGARPDPMSETIVVFVDRNPIRKVLEYQPLARSPAWACASARTEPVRYRAAAAGVWHVRRHASRFVRAASCTVSSATRRTAAGRRRSASARQKLFASSPVGGENASRLRDDADGPGLAVFAAPGPCRDRQGRRSAWYLQW